MSAPRFVILEWCVVGVIWLIADARKNWSR